MLSLKKRVSDPFYAGIKRRRLRLYQKYLNALFLVIDVDNYTRWTNSNAYDRATLKRDERLITRVSREDAASYDLCPEFLQTMIHQYFLADPLLREGHKGKWAETVVYSRDAMGFFPEAKRVRRLLDVSLKVRPGRDETRGYRLSA